MKRRQHHYGPAFAQILVPLRESKGLSQEQLAERSNVPLRRIRQYERGTVDPFVPDMIAIALALDVDAVTLFKDTLRKGKREAGAE